MISYQIIIRFNSIVTLFALFLVSCGQQKKSDTVSLPTQLKYATGFSVRAEGNSKHVIINLPYPGAEEAYHYLLVPQGEEVPAHDNQTQVVYTPIKKIVCTSTTHIPLLDYINETEALIGFPTTDYISSKK
ncbi:MAG: hypothetical protein IPK96_11105 [Flammeovirgaceae bacterium]|nr:hypothetical protein [Flammeovirgaceae bacterium]